MSKPLTRSELDAVRHGTLTDCQCKDCRLLATIAVLEAEIVAWRTLQSHKSICHEPDYGVGRLIEKSRAVDTARSRTDAAKILPK